MSNWYLKFVGKVFARTVGRLDRYSDDHSAFLSSGYVCPSCRRTLMRWWGAATAMPIAANGQPVPLLMARAKGERFRCPECNHEWKFRSP